MPKIDNDDTIVFNILPKYFEAIQTGAKTADLRLLNKERQVVLEKMTYVRFECEETGEWELGRITNISYPLLTMQDVRGLYGDIPWDSDGSAGQKFRCIHFERISP